MTDDDRYDVIFVYYEVDEDLKLVIILAVVYKWRDQLDALFEI